jgi:diguanylate cyclase (GGDEF)-like protein
VVSIRRSLFDWGNLLCWAAGAVLAAYLLLYFSGWGSPGLRTAITDGAYVPISLVATVLAVRVVRERRLDPRVRRAWRFMAAAFGCQLAANAIWFWLENVRHETPYPSLSDIGYLAFIPLICTGLLTMPVTPRSRRERQRLALDALTVLVSTFMLIWYLVLGPTVVAGGPDPLTVAVSVAYPVGDLVIVFGVATVVMRGVGQEVARPLGVLAGALLLFVVADVYYGYVGLHAGFVGGTWPDLFWLGGNLLMGVSAHVQHRFAHRHQAYRDRRRGISWLPYGAIALAYGLMVLLARRVGLYPMGGMIVGVIALTLLVVVRQVNVLRENRELAVTDPLTGLANRALVQARLTAATRQLGKPGYCAAVLLIDLDRFKPINDTLGHDAGDAVLVAVADTLRGVTRRTDTAGRLGGDEFVVILDGLPGPAAVRAVAERIVDSLRTPVVYDGHLLEISASIGVAIRSAAEPIPQDRAAVVETLLQEADLAMYAAKRGGRSGYTFFEADLDVGRREAELRHAIEHHQFVLHYQPLVDLHTESPVGVEALVRWQDPQRGLLQPAQFLPLAEETGLIAPLGAWVLAEACAQMARWHRELPGAADLMLNVNMSPRQVRHPGLVSEISAVLEQTGLDPSRLVLELTEHSMLEIDEATIGKLRALRGLGVGIAVDDFGTGYSALHYLQRLPVNVLKMDRSFVTQLCENADGYAIGDAVVRLGQALHLDVVAEGIETSEQVSALRQMGCYQGQGYHFGRPADAAATEAVLRQALALQR